MSEFLEFKSALQRFVRSFNHGNKDSTPCGQKISPATAHALMAIGNAKNKELPQLELVSHLGIDKSNVTRLCTELERQGWIKRTKAINDRRQFNLSLTPKGKKLYESLEQSSNSYINLVLSELPISQRKQLISSLNKMTEITNKLNKGE